MLLFLLFAMILLVGFVAAACVSFLRYAPPPDYNVATTEEVKAPTVPCVSVEAPELPEAKKQDVRAQLENDVLSDAVNATCDTNVKVTCHVDNTYYTPRYPSCAANYHGREIPYGIQWFGCDSVFCEYQLHPRDFFLTKRRLHEAFWKSTRSRGEIDPGASLRCDILPGEADVFPATDPDSGHNSPSVPTKYRCYAHNPQSITYKYRVIASANNISFEEE